MGVQLWSIERTAVAYPKRSRGWRRLLFWQRPEHETGLALVAGRELGSYATTEEALRVADDLGLEEFELITDHSVYPGYILHGVPASA